MQNEMFRYEILVGFNDGDSKIQEHPYEVYEKIIINVCRGYRISYSINRLTGGYIHEDGTYIKENSASILLLGINDEQAEEIAKDLSAFFNQESVLIIKSPIELKVISEKINL